MSSSAQNLVTPPAPESSPGTSSSGAGESAPQDGWPGGLASLRAELDRIDDTIHALLIERAGIVEQVARQGKPSAFRPGREASIVRRLLARHRGSLPPQTLFRMWRELLAGTTAMQSPVIVAVCDGDPGAAMTQLAREHFGTFTPLHVHGGPGQALADVAAGTATVAVLPLPSQANAARDVWWTSLPRRKQRLHVIARLPFWTARAEGAPDARALVVAAAPPDQSERDRSLLVFELEQSASRARLTADLTAAGLPVASMVLRADPNESLTWALVEIEGYVTDGDPRLAALPGRPWVLGGYAEPVEEVA